MTSYKRVAHAVASVGLAEIVICASEGTSTVWVDRNGDLIEHGQAGDCMHCADCSLMPVFAATSMTSHLVVATAAIQKFTALTALPTRQFRVEHPSRGPPTTNKV